MSNEEMMQAIFGQLEKIAGRLDSLEEGQKSMRADIEGLKESQKDMRAEMKDMRADVEDLKEGQKSIRRDIARVDRKIDRLSADVGDTLVYVTDSVGNELEMLKKAK